MTSVSISNRIMLLDSFATLVCVFRQLDSKTKEWIVKSAQCDYQALAKIASENPRIAKFKVRFFRFTNKLFLR